MSSAAIITWNTQGVSTNVAAGILSFDELRSSTSHTYVDVAGAGFDLKVSSSGLMEYSTGDLNYVKPNQSLLFEFFATGTSNPIDVTGFSADWRDLDNVMKAGTFTIKDKLGATTILDTSSSLFTLGANLTAMDLNAGNGVKPDAITSSASGNWDNLGTAFITDLSSTPLHSFSLDATTDWIAPTSLRLVGVDKVDIVRVDGVKAVPEPATFIIWSLLGAASWLGMTVTRRRRGMVGGKGWSPENRQAIHEIISRGTRR